ncbi:MAG: hypothetical protein A2849_02930 [Candidatus Taylorbacteria bacterium RIFCSPHIGHO2_01_FULL_51_15]|uniref:Uncharacterized protein n=1 Tax=Candidatus Taylorbacteria bacterium RIFCSPHIGHO2_01_FULL_51_15 TaxID=1802304 RepID=A0A1G2M8S9_9BACT|nr:MAG: hypothetical protein A2849_02930 [Candidatus Taylorbacteria bacterium RIFCSPHIGHO2_01_FULL_51_15]
MSRNILLALLLVLPLLPKAFAATNDLNVSAVVTTNTEPRIIKITLFRLGEGVDKKGMKKFTIEIGWETTHPNSIRQIESSNDLVSWTERAEMSNIPSPWSVTMYWDWDERHLAPRFWRVKERPWPQQL